MDNSVKGISILSALFVHRTTVLHLLTLAGWNRTIPRKKTVHPMTCRMDLILALSSTICNALSSCFREKVERDRYTPSYENGEK